MGEIRRKGEGKRGEWRESREGKESKGWRYLSLKVGDLRPISIPDWGGAIEATGSQHYCQSVCPRCVRGPSGHTGHSAARN